MKHRKLVIVGACLVVVAAGAAVGYAWYGRDAATTPQYWEQARKTKSAGSCLAADPDARVPNEKLQEVEMAAITHLIDVPAGTDVDVRFASYSDTRATGSDIYPEKYGSYNFELVKQADGWRVARFERCD